MAESTPDLALDLPEAPELVEQVRQYRCTGARCPSDQAEGIVEDLLLSHSAKRIARKWGVNPRTVRAIRDSLTDSAHLAPVKERLVRRLSRITELASEVLEDGLEEGAISPGQVSVPLGIAVEKLLLLTGQPTSISQRKGDDAGADVRAYLESLKRVASPSVVTVSSEVVSIAGVSEPSASVVSVCDAVSSQPEPGADRQKEGGGGGAAPGGRCDERCITEKSAEG